LLGIVGGSKKYACWHEAYLLHAHEARCHSVYRRLDDRAHPLTRSRNVIAPNPALLVIGGTIYYLHAAVSFGDLICCHCRLSWCKQDNRDRQGCSQIG